MVRTPGEGNEAPVVAKQLTKRYPPDLFAVDHIDLEIRKGIVFSLLGPNGAGKTTTVEILEGLRNLTSGEAWVLGADVRIGYASIRSRIGVLPQDFEPFDRLTPAEAVTYWAKLFQLTFTTSDADRLLETVGLAERSKVHAMHLSGGEKRKLGIALSLVNDPELLFLDEPTTGLDPRARRDLWKLIRAIREKGTTILLTTHYLDEAEQLSDEVAIMHKGKIIAQGPPKELVARSSHGTTIVLAGAGAFGLSEVQRRGIPAQLVNSDVLVPVHDPEEMRTYLAKLSALELKLTDMYTTRPTLEDVFLSLVGAKMEEGVLQA